MSLYKVIVSASLLSSALAAPAPQAADAPSRFTYFDLKTPLAAPCDLNTGPDGNIYASTFLSDKLVFIDRTSPNPTLQEITIPYTLPQLPESLLPASLQGAGSCVVQPGADGNVYLATGVRNQLAQYNPRTGMFKFFENSPLGNLQPFNDAWPTDKGLYFTQTTANVLTYFEYESETLTSYALPTPGAGPIGVIVVPNGDVWIAEFTGQKVAKFCPSTKKFTEYPVPATGLGPAVVRAFTEGKYIWYTAILGNALLRVDITNGSVEAITDTANLGVPIEDTNDGKGNVWFSTAASNTLNYYTPSTGKFTTIAQPDGGVSVAGVASVPPRADIAIHWVYQDNSMWFTEFEGNRVGRYQLDSTQ